MRILRAYFFRNICAATGLVLAVLLSLGGFIELVTQLDDIGEGDYGLAAVLLYVLMKLPNIAFFMLPITVLLGALLGLGSLASRSEIVALRAAGVSNADLARTVLVTGVILGVFTLTLGEYIAPPLERFARQYRAVAKFGPAGLDTGQSAWIRSGDLIVNIQRPSAEDPKGGVYLFRVGPGRLLGLGRADSVQPDDQGSWAVRGFQGSRFTADAIVAGAQLEALDVAGLDPDLLGLTVVRPETLDGRALWAYVSYLKRNGLEAASYEVAFWARIASSFAVAVMCVLAVPFAAGYLRRSGTGARLLTGLGIGLAYFLLSRALSDSGEVWNLNPFVVAWLPTTLLTVCTLVVLRRVR